MENVEATSLSILPVELLHVITSALATDVRTLGRLACSCRALSEALGSDSAFIGALRALCGPEQDARGAKARVKSLSTLQDATWVALTARQVPGTCYHAAFVHGDTLIVFGGTVRYQHRHHFNTSTTWALDIRSGVWHKAATEGGRQPEPRSFPADIGGCGGVLRDAAGKAWLLLFGGSRPGVRDNETWILGPLGPAAGAAGWHWFEVQSDGSAQSRSRPCPRFHHTLTVVAEGAPTRGALLLYGGHNYRIDPVEEAYTLSVHDVDLVPAAQIDEEEPELVGLEGVRWRPWSAVDDGERPGARARHATVWWPHRGLIILGGYHGDDEDAHLGFGSAGDTEPDCEVWWSRGPFIGGHAQWQQLPSMPEAAMLVTGEDGLPANEGTLDVAAVVLRDNERMLVAAGSDGVHPKLWLLDMSPWRWTRCELTGDVPRGPRVAWRTLRSCADVLLFCGGHDGSATNSFGDPQVGHYAPHEARLARVVTGSEGETPRLRFGGCVQGSPPTAHFEGWVDHAGMHARHRGLLLHGLESRAELNGRRATLAAKRSNARDRWKVELEPVSASEAEADAAMDASNGTVLVKHENMAMDTWLTAPTMAWCEDLQLVVETHMELQNEDAPVLATNVMRLWGQAEAVTATSME